MKLQLQIGKSNPSKSCVQQPDPESKEKRQGDKVPKLGTMEYLFNIYLIPDDLL